VASAGCQAISRQRRPHTNAARHTVAIACVVALIVGLAAIPSVAYAYPGDLDPSFGGGTVLTSIGTTARAYGLVVQPDGKTVAVGHTSASQSNLDFALVRYSLDGTLDPGFGNGGTVISHLATISQANAVARQTDGKLVVAGTAIQAPSSAQQVVLARYLADGTLDSSFGDNGTVLSFGSPFGAVAVLVQPDGKIAVALSQPPDICGPDPCPNGKLAVARYLADGAPDTGFGSGGLASVAIPDSDSGPQPRSLVRQASGRLIVGGVARQPSTSTYRPTLAAVTADGAPDAGFGSGGVAFGPDGHAGSAGLQSDGRVVLSFAPPDTAMAAVRWTTTGTLDSTFGDAGIARFQDGLVNVATAGTVQPDDAVVLGGYADIGPGDPLPEIGWGLTRFSAAGTPDHGFGQCGRTAHAIGDDQGVINALAMGSGTILAVGSARESGTTKFAVARYLGGTAAPRLPAATTGSVTNLAARSATLHGTANAGGTPSTAYLEHQPTDGSWGSDWGHSPDQHLTGDTDQTISADVSFLQPATSYRYRAVAHNGCGTVTGATATFTTPAAPPTIVSAYTTDVAASQATLRGTIIPNGAATTYHFEYGPTPSYGTAVPIPDGTAGSDSTQESFVAHAIAGLSPATTYHFRLVAQNAEGTTSSGDQTFTTATPPADPPPTDPPPAPPPLAPPSTPFVPIAPPALQAATILSTQRLSTGQLVATITVGQPGSTVTGTVLADHRLLHAARLRVIATAVKRRVPAGRLKLAIRLSPRLRRQLGRARRPRVIVRVTVRPPAGRAMTRQTAVRLRR
jgi:uncharacterized delta-60 repeat protein